MKKELIQFSAINPQKIIPQLKKLLQKNKETIQRLTNAKQPPTWRNLMQPLEQLDVKIQQLWSAVSHLNSVQHNPKLSRAYQQGIKLLSAYDSKLSQNKKLFSKINEFYQSTSFAKLDAAQQKVITHCLRDFRLGGVHLSTNERQAVKQLRKQLTSLSERFENNVISSMAKWHHHVEDEKRLQGLPAHVIERARNEAQQKKQSGFIFHLDYPTYDAVLSYADDRELRYTFYHAYVTRASELGVKEHNNTNIMNEIIKLRHKLANKLGFKHYADYALATRMANSSEQVVNFLTTLTQQARAKALQQLRDLKSFLDKQNFREELMPWDTAYFNEKLKKRLFQFSDEELRRYFELTQVLTGLFNVLKQLFGIEFKLIKKFDSYHPDVKLYSIYHHGKLCGYFYLDLFARKFKRDGAWMDDALNRYRKNTHTVQKPVAFVTCNFTPPNAKKQSLLTHDEVLTLFHEMGHALQHLLTQVDYISLSGIRGIPWDAVEIPSQFLENWCWHPRSLSLLAKDVFKQKAMPKTMIKKLIEAKQFQSALRLLRQIEFALFDWIIHSEAKSLDKNFIQQSLDKVRKQVSVMPIAPFNRFQHSFTHIFSGGYAAGYYSYLWAELIACDAFREFEKKGIFNLALGQKFLECFLEPGGTGNPNDAFKAFAKREPDVKSLLQHYGIF